VGMPSQKQVKLVTDYDAESAYNLAYQTLFANIRFSWSNTPGQFHTVLFTTPATYTDKGTALANTAITAAQNGTPTVLVDADIHGTGLQQYFDLGEHPGLSDLLLMESATTLQKIGSCLQKTFLPDLTFLSAGSKIQQPQDISKQLSFKLKNIIDGLRQLFEGDENRQGLIIFNSPPVLSSIDAALISALVDQTFLLIASGQTARAQAKKAYEQLERAHAKITGLIMLDA
jgi:capsular exopolysaccharide synthesis family protein